MSAHVSDLYGCYHDLLAGETPESLARRYNRFEVLAAQGLYAKGATLEELKRCQDKLAARLEAAEFHAPYCVCVSHEYETRDGHESIPCGLACFDREEFDNHALDVMRRPEVPTQETPKIVWRRGD